jgi:hypothetical protein
MSEVVQFPGIDERMWCGIESNFRNLALGRGIPREAVEWILADIKPRLLSKSALLPMTIPVEAMAPVKEVSEFMHRCHDELVGQMFFLEFELYAAKFGGGHPQPPLEMTAKLFGDRDRQA